MGILTDLLLGGGINDFLFWAIAVTIFSVLWFIFIVPYIAFIPIVNRINVFILLAPFIAWGLYFLRNFTVNFFSNPIYVSVLAVVLLLIFVWVVTSDKSKKIGKKLLRK